MLKNWWNKYKKLLLGMFIFSLSAGIYSKVIGIPVDKVPFWKYLIGMVFLMIGSLVQYICGVYQWILDEKPVDNENETATMDDNKGGNHEANPNLT